MRGFSSLAFACAVLTLAVASCAAPPALTGAAKNFGTQAEALTPQAARVAFSVHQALPSSPYRLNYIQELDWDTCTIALTNTTPSVNLSSGALTPTDTAGVRTANYAFNGVTPASGYTVTVTLKRAGTTVASGTLSSVTINPGPNSVNVPVTLNNQNVVTIEPTLVSNDSLTANVATNGYASIGTAAAPKFSGSTTGNTTLGNYKEVSGIDIDSAENVYVSDAKESRIVAVTSAGVASLVAGVAGTTAFTADGAITGTTSLNVPRGLVHEASSSGRLIFAEFGTTNADGRIRLIAGSGPAQLTTYAGGGAGAAGGSNVDALSVQLNGPSGVAADGNGNVFFTEVGQGVVRRVLESTRVLLTLDTPPATTTSNFGPLCIDRTNNVLYYSVGNQIYSLTSPAGTPGGRTSVTTLTAANLGALINTPVTITGLATDGQGLVYATVASTSAVPFDSDGRVVRIPVTATGTLNGLSGRQVDVIAGSGAKISANSNDVAAQVLAGTSQVLGCNMNNLAIDLQQSNVGNTLSGVLYVGNTNASATPYSEVLQLFPPTGAAPTGFSKF